MGTDTDIITSNNIIFPAVRDLFARGCVLPNNHILSDIHITVNDDPWTGGQHDTFTSSCARADTPLLCRRPVFYLYRTFSLLLITWKRDFTGRASPERKPPCPCMPFLIRRRITDLSRVIMPAFRYSGKWRFYPWGQKCGNMETGQQKNHHDGFFSKKWEHMSFI